MCNSGCSADYSGVKVKQNCKVIYVLTKRKGSSKIVHLDKANRGPSLVPCGTPANMSFKVDVEI